MFSQIIPPFVFASFVSSYSSYSFSFYLLPLFNTFYSSFLSFSFYSFLFFLYLLLFLLSNVFCFFFILFFNALIFVLFLLFHLLFFLYISLLFLCLPLFVIYLFFYFSILSHFFIFILFHLLLLLFLFLHLPFYCFFPLVPFPPFTLTPSPLLHYFSVLHILSFFLSRLLKLLFSPYILSLPQCIFIFFIIFPFSPFYLSPSFSFFLPFPPSNYNSYFHDLISRLFPIFPVSHLLSPLSHPHLTYHFIHTRNYKMLVCALRFKGDNLSTPCLRPIF